MLISVMMVLSSVVVMDLLSESSSILLAPFVIRCVGFVVAARALGSVALWVSGCVICEMTSDADVDVDSW